ncbi:PREDICTED: ethanolamine kinase 2-like, partial [Priapulus caudatus]|uniref:ethanolamine kinase n=1 Tax=Priapulus caudatus TaxID=37621 RepID=A0ABM1F678_PRICU
MRNLTRLHAAGCCPPLYARFNNGLCYGYAVGTCPSVDDIATDPIYRYRRHVPNIETLRTEVEVLEHHLVDLDSPVVFCHNDLVLNNIVYNKTEGT